MPAAKATDTTWLPADDPHRRDLEEIHKAALSALSRLAQIFPEGE